MEAGQFNSIIEAISKFVNSYTEATGQQNTILYLGQKNIVEDLIIREIMLISGFNKNHLIITKINNTNTIIITMSTTDTNKAQSLVIETKEETETALGGPDVIIMTQKTLKINLLQNKIYNLNLNLSFFMRVGINNTNSIIT